jgi:hypothetical protein
MYRYVTIIAAFVLSITFGSAVRADYDYRQRGTEACPTITAPAETAVPGPSMGGPLRPYPAGLSPLDCTTFRWRLRKSRLALLSSRPGLIAGRNGVPAKDLKGLIGWLKANPDKALMASGGGAASPGHMSGSFFRG